MFVFPQERRVQELERKVWEYNHQFWAQHNHRFREGKNAFAQSRLAGGRSPSTLVQCSLDCVHGLRTR